MLTAGHCHDSPQAPALIEGFSAQVLSADKGYDADALVEAVTAEGVQAVIPPRANRPQPPEYDQPLYRERHLIAGFINKLKHSRHVCSRVEKLSQNFLGFLSVVSALIWLR